jgi:hypothetical protein
VRRKLRANLNAREAEAALRARCVSDTEFVRIWHAVDVQEVGVMQDEDWVPLSAMVRMLRSELATAVDAAEGEDLQFRLGPIELEFQVGVTNEGGGEAGIRFWVVSLGAKGARAREQTHRIKLILTPHRASDPGADVDVSTTGRLGN